MAKNINKKVSKTENKNNSRASGYGMASSGDHNIMISNAGAKQIVEKIVLNINIVNSNSEDIKKAIINAIKNIGIESLNALGERLEENNDIVNSEIIEPINKAVNIKLNAAQTSDKAEETEKEAKEIVDQVIVELKKEAFDKKIKSSEIDFVIIDKKEKTDSAVANIIKDFATVARGYFTVFISATTNKRNSDDKTLEYEVALKLKQKLKEKDCNVFWWEDDVFFGDERMSDLWSISTKISFGLAFSSLFVGLAFDTVTPADNGKYVYNCMYTEGDKAYKIPNYFKYEVKKFDSLRNTKKIKQFVNPIIQKQKDFVKYVPHGKDKNLKFYTLGNPESYSDEYEMFNNRGYITPNVNEKIRKIYESDVEPDQKAEEIANIIIANISEGGLLDKLLEEQRKFIDVTPVLEEPECFKPYIDESDKDKSEDVASMPCDYLFKYAILDGNGDSAKEHFTIFPEKTMGKEGWDWSLKLLYKDLNYYTTGVYTTVRPREITDIANIKGDKTTHIPPEQLKNDDNGVVTLTRDNNSSFGHTTGTISIGENDNKTMYTFEILFYPKRVLHYKYCSGLRNGYFELVTDKRKSYIDSDNFKVDVLYQTGEPVPEMSDISLSELKSNGGIEKSYILRPSGEAANYYVLLKDDESKNDEPLPLVKRKNRCPYCGRYMGSGKDECHSRKRKKCSWNFIYNYFDDGSTNKENINAKAEAREKFYFSDVSSEDIPTKLKNQQLKPNPGMEINRPKFDSTLVISILGKSQSGKSTFISSLFGARSKQRLRTAPGCDYIKNTLSHYINNKNISCCATNGPISKDGGKDQNANISALNLEYNYSPTLYHSFVSGTPTDKNELISHIPYTLELKNIQGKGKSACLSFFDVPGGFISKGDDEYDDDDDDVETENEEKDNEARSLEFEFLENGIEDSTMAFGSDCLIVLVNGKSKNAFVVAKELLSRLKTKYDAAKKDRSNIILAVVLCKFDMFADKFSQNSYLRTTPPVIIGNYLKFGGSATREYINNCSRELAEYIEHNGNTDLVNEVKTFTNRYKFFAVSSIGRKDSIVLKKNSKGKYLKSKLYFTEPSNIENVLLWIMYQAGIIE